MKTAVVVVFASLCVLASAQLEGTLSGLGPLSSGMGDGGGAGMMGGASNPMLTMLLMQFAMADPSAMSLPVVSMLMRNPAMMQNPMGALMISSMLGVDVNKIATPLAMVNGMGGGIGSLMRWLPLMTGDPNIMSLMFSMGGMGGMGGLGGLGTMMPMIAANM